MSTMSTMRDMLALSPVIPVVVIDDAAHAVPLARALLEGGIRVVEITLRTPAAISAIKAVTAEVPEITVGAGTVLTPGDAKAASDANAAFAVCPGFTDTLIDACASHNLPLLPGATTPAEMMALAARNITAMKFFPAVPSGGTAYLKSIAGPLPDLIFCPTGGIDAANAREFLALDNVACVGGSWIASRDDINKKDWGGITARAKNPVKN